MIGSLFPEKLDHADRVEVTRNDQTNQFSVVLCISAVHDASFMHRHHIVGDGASDSQVARDEKVGQATG